MPRRGSRIIQADIARIVRGMRAAGVSRVRTVIRADGIYIEVDERGPEQDARGQEAVPADILVAPERIVPL